LKPKKETNAHNDGKKTTITTLKTITTEKDFFQSIMSLRDSCESINKLILYQKSINSTLALLVKCDGGLSIPIAAEAALQWEAPHAASVSERNVGLLNKNPKSRK